MTVADLSPEARYRVTLTSVGYSATTISDDAASVTETIDAVNDAFSTVSGDGSGSNLFGFGILGLPIMATWVAMKKAAEQYVGQRTGQSLKDWMTFVDAASEQFDHYVTVLDSLQRFIAAQSSVAEPGESWPVDSSDEEQLLDVRQATQAWKVILKRVSQLSQLVDAVLAAQTESPIDSTETSEGKSKWTSMLQDKVSDAVSQGNFGNAELREWLLRPLVDLRDQIQDLPGAVDRLAEEVSVLEVKLELAVAQLQALRGTIAEDDVELMELRVAGTVLLPDLISELNRAESELEEIESHREKLSDLHSDGKISDVVRERLDAVYAKDRASAVGKLARLNSDVSRWQTDGSKAIADGLSWVDGEVDFLDARQKVESDDGISQRITLLKAERRRLGAVREFLEKTSG